MLPLHHTRIRTERSHTRTRTWNLAVNSRPLLPLSYVGIEEGPEDASVFTPQTSVLVDLLWSPRRESNARLLAYKASALPPELHGHLEPTIGLEPTTPCLRNRCSTIELRGQSERVAGFEPSLVFLGKEVPHLAASPAEKKPR